MKRLTACLLLLYLAGCGDDAAERAELAAYWDASSEHPSPDKEAPSDAAAKLAENMAIGTREAKIRSELAYLTRFEPDDFASGQVEEVKWIRIENCTIYIGFNYTKLPENLDWIIKGAALRANKATGFTCRVWAMEDTEWNRVAGKPKTGRDGLPGSDYFSVATAANGRVIRSANYARHLGQ